MALSKRERIILAAFGAVVALLLADTYVLRPLWQARKDDADLRQKLEHQQWRNRQTLRLGKTMEAKWLEITASGMKAERGQVESQVYRAVSLWERESGLSVSEVVPRKQPSDSQLAGEAAFRVVGRGTFRPVTAFLWRMQTAAFPLKIRKTEITSLKPGTTDLTLNVVVEFSTLYSPEAGHDATATTQGGPER
jgi:hypothetical protein